MDFGLSFLTESCPIVIEYHSSYPTDRQKAVYQVRSIIVPGLLNALDEDPNMRMKDVKKEITRTMKAINELSTGVVVVTSVELGGRLSEPVLCTFKKRIQLVQKEKHGNLKVELYNQGDSKVVNLTERELKIIPKN
jgi:hypothetical protein